MSLHGELKLFAIQVIYDIEEYYLQNVHQLSETQGYISQRCALYSKFGHKTILHFLKNQLVNILTKMETDPSLQNINDDIFEFKVAAAIALSSWRTMGHKTFYETCARIVVLGIFAMGHGKIGENKIVDSLVNFAEKAHTVYYLDPIYDSARQTAQDITYTLFKLLGIDVSAYITDVEKELGWTELQFSEAMHEFINNELPITLERFRSFKKYEKMNSVNFDGLVKTLLEEFEVDSIYKTTNYNDNFVLLAVSIGFISYYSIKVNYREGIQKGFDAIVRLAMLEKRSNFISDATKKYYDQLNQRNN